MGIGRTTRYRLALDNESRLERIFQIRMSRSGLVALVAGIALGAVVVAVLLIVTTPLRTLLPGYLKESERSASQEGILRIDSLAETTRRQQDWIMNFARVIDTDRFPTDSAAAERPTVALTVDSLIPRSADEERFTSQMREKERYALSVIAPLEAEGMIFHSVSAASVVSERSRSLTAAQVLMGAGAPVCAIADGVVIDVYSKGPSAGTTIVMQHASGFASSVSHVASATVEPGQKVNGGSAIGLSMPGTGIDRGYVTVRMWHNSNALIPYEYIGGGGPSETSRAIQSHAITPPQGRK